VGAEASGDPFRSVVGEHGTYVDAETSERLDDVVDETDGVAGGDGPDDDEDDRPAGGDVDGGQLVHLADALEVADVKAVGRHQVAGRRAVVAEPERLGVAAGFGGQPGGGRGDRRSPGHALRASTEPVVDEELLHRRLADPVATLAEAVGVLATAQRRLDDGQGQQVLDDVGRSGVGQLRCPTLLGHQRVGPVAGDDATPLVVTGAGDAHLPARR